VKSLLSVMSCNNVLTATTSASCSMFWTCPIRTAKSQERTTWLNRYGSHFCRAYSVARSMTGDVGTCIPASTRLSIGLMSICLLHLSFGSFSARLTSFLVGSRENRLCGVDDEHRKQACWCCCARVFTHTVMIAGEFREAFTCA